MVPGLRESAGTVLHAWKPHDHDNQDREWLQRLHASAWLRSSEQGKRYVVKWSRGGKIEFRRQVDWPVIHVVKIDNLYPAIHWKKTGIVCIGV
jgi:hypothetical protein